MATKTTQNLKRKRQNLRNKNILITAGPTWVPIDNVRVISNASTGQTGILLAERLSGLGAKPTLLLGPTEARCLKKQIRLIRFRFFQDLKNLIKRELKNRRYDIVIHLAAVSDYRPVKIYNHKVKSGIKNWQIKLVPTEKIIESIKQIDASLFLVGFKFQPLAAKDKLLVKARELMKKSGADLVVANTTHNSSYTAYIVGKNKASGKIISKKELSKRLVREIGENLCQN